MAAELEEALHESSDLIQSSGGVFEIEDHGTLIFSKKQLGRFPGDTEVLEIVKAIDSGVPLTEAQAKAKEGVPEPISFFSWLGNLLGLSQAK